MFSVLSLGIFLWIWMVMQALYVRKLNPSSRIANFAWVAVVPGALFYINLPSVLLALREKDHAEMARLEISMVLWGTIGAALLVTSLVWIAIAKRRLALNTGYPQSAAPQTAQPSPSPLPAHPTPSRRSSETPPP